MFFLNQLKTFIALKTIFNKKKKSFQLKEIEIKRGAINIETTNNEKKPNKLKELLKTALTKVKNAITRDGEYTKEPSRINKTKKDFEREIVVGYFVAYLVIVGFGILFGLSHRNIFSFVSSLVTTIIGTHIFYSIIGLLAYVLLKEFGEKYTLIYDKFEERKERVLNIHKPEGEKLHIVTTDKGVYGVDISNGNVFIGDKKEEKLKNNTETKDNTEIKIKQSVISILKEDTVETKAETKKKRRRTFRRRPNIR